MSKIKQGYIIHGISSDIYNDSYCYGLIATASCDIAQQKVNRIHYITLISLEEWLINDGFILIITESLKEILGNIKKWMLDHKFNPDFIEDLGTLKVRQLIEGSKDSSKKKKLILKSVEKWEEVVGIKKNSITSEKIKELLNLDYIKQRNNKIKLLVENKVTGYYYIPHSELKLTSEKLGYIVNLRDIQSMDLESFDLLKNNKIDLKINPDIIKNDKLSKLFVLDEENDFACIDSQLDSPRLEHLMQHFSLMFTRIGLTDISKEHQSEMFKCLL